MKVLANDGLAESGVATLENAGFEVIKTKVAQEQLEDYINQNNIDALLVRSATQVPGELIDACPSIKLVGRGGVGMDNIDVDYAREQGVHVINTPKASSHSVGELVFSHIFGLARNLHDANRNMPLEGDSNFKQLKKAYGAGVELKGQTLGLIGFGRIGQATAKIALGLGMKVIAFDPYMESVDLSLEFFDGQEVKFTIPTTTKEEVLKNADFLSLHVPAQENYVIDEKEFELMKNSACIVNAARGGVVNEVALVKALEKGQIAKAALDVFENEPQPAVQVLMNPNISLTPHIGAATIEAQSRIGIELAEQIINLLKE